MAHILSLDCPNCGAPLEDDAVVERVRCSYCGTLHAVAAKARRKSPPSYTPRRPAEPEGPDDLLLDAARIMVRTQMGSVSLLQRKLAVGYTRAARIVDQLEDAGIVGPFEGSAAREVLYTDEEEAVGHLTRRLARR